MEVVRDDLGLEGVRDAVGHDPDLGVGIALPLAEDGDVLVDEALALDHVDRHDAGGHGDRRDLAVRHDGNAGRLGGVEVDQVDSEGVGHDDGLFELVVDDVSEEQADAGEVERVGDPAEVKVKVRRLQEGDGDRSHERNVLQQRSEMYPGKKEDDASSISRCSLCIVSR